MPDQYTLSEFQRNELTPGHQPVMAEIDLTSSHIPWAPRPAMVQMSSWHWRSGLLPAPSAPLEPMDAFRNQLLNTFNSKTPGR